MSTTWFTSDLHLGHPFVAKLRGFDDVEEHDRTLLGNMLDVLEEGDTLWFLGDLSSGWGPQEERALDLFDATLEPLRNDVEDPVVVHLISGNHDTCHPLHEEAPERQRRFLEVFDTVQTQQIMFLQGEEVWLSHFPRPGQDHEGMSSRHDDMRLNVPLLVHGHLHSETPVTGPGQIDVGVDAWHLAPVRQETLEEVLFSSSL
ncbi:phosphoprotein phosphatase [Corynebacterium sp. 4HC-13]|uniref:metallophosphoesterase n=1 Tax=Corynebacterium anserum TaxID=2684406 RepID=UPI00163AAE84|nr:metallophosphoesterase [Corynebacterium anserum]MBC2681122.1 phosphoprotein phosphatase [Corynebacterium anserum]